MYSFYLQTSPHKVGLHHDTKYTRIRGPISNKYKYLRSGNIYRNIKSTGITQMNHR